MDSDGALEKPASFEIVGVTARALLLRAPTLGFAPSSSPDTPSSCGGASAAEGED